MGAKDGRRRIEQGQRCSMTWSNRSSQVGDGAGNRWLRSCPFWGLAQVDLVDGWSGGLVRGRWGGGGVLVHP